MLSKSFKAGKCKTSLKLAVARIKLLKNKRGVQVKQLKRDLAGLLETGQDQTARIRVEHAIREEKTMAAYDLIELYCELIVARLAIIESQKNCPIDLKEAISSVIFASPRCADIPELLDVRKHFVAKYGKEFATSAVELRPDCGVNRLVVEKLSAKAPDIETKIKVLTAIAQEYNIKWEPKAFEELVQKPSEDLLNGPTSFAHTMPVESSTIQFPPSPAQKHKSATKPYENDMERSAVGFNSFTPPSVESASHPGRRAAASTYDERELEQTHVKEELASSSRQKWGMEFKDATSAAQAAAESAERASIAARAAAELASHGNDPEYSYRSHESSVYEPKREAGNLMSSKLQGESLTRNSVKRDNSINSTKQRFHSGLEVEGLQDHITRDSWSMNKDSESARNQYSRIVSSPSVSSPSERDATKANWHRKKSGKDVFSGEGSTERHPIKSVSSNSSNSSHDGDVYISNLRESDSFTPESLFMADPANQNLGERTDIADAGRGGIERKSSKSLSSHSSVSSIDHEATDSPVHENYVNQPSLFGTGQETDHGHHKHGFSVAGSAIFDKSDSENDDDLEVDSFIKNDATESTLQHLSSKLDYSASRQQYSGFNVKNGSSSSLHSMLRSQPAEFSGIARQNDPPSQSDAVVFDVSDRASSDSEDEMDAFTDRGDTVLNTSHDRKNVAQFEHPQSLSRSSTKQKDMETMGKLKQSDADTEFHYGLNFGRLTGGLKHKGYLHPTYVKNPVLVESLSLESSTDDSSQKHVASPENMVASFEADRKTKKNQKPYSRRNEDSSSRYQNSSDSDIEAENLEQRLASRSSGYRGVIPLLSTSKLDDHLTIEHKPKASITLTKADSIDANEEKSRRRSIQRTSKESTSHRTSAAAYVDNNTERQPLSPAGRRRSGDDASSILFNENLQDTRATVSDTSKLSGQSNVYGMTSSVQTYKGSVSTATPFFDEENDEDEMLQPRETLRNVSTKSGRRRLSQRTRRSREDQPSNVGASSRDSFHDLKTPDLESKSFESTDSISETPLKPFTAGLKPGENRPSKFLLPSSSTEQREAQFSETKVSVQKDGLSTHSVSETPFKSSNRGDKPEKYRSKFFPPHLSIEQHPVVLSQDEVFPQKDDLEPSQRSSSHNNPSHSISAEAASPATSENLNPSTSGGGSTSRENSFKGSHVHPKLPDYESLAGYFKSLRSNTKQK